MTKPVRQPGAPKSRFPILGTVAGVLAAGAIAWVIVDRIDTPSVQPAVSGSVAGKETPRTLDKPLWDDLSSVQQVALAPLEPEWNRMDGTRKRKWIEMSSRFASMQPPEQQRVHQRMRQWLKLTPEQRELARENYSRANRLAQGDKAADWKNYNRLTEDQKRTLARTAPAARKSTPVALPEAPMLVVPTPCPPNTTRRGAECIVAGIPELPAAAAPAPSALAGAVGTTGATGTNGTPPMAPAQGGAVTVPPAAAPAAGASAQGSSAPATQASNAGN